MSIKHIENMFKFLVIQILMSAAQTMEGVSTRVSTLLVLTSVSAEVDMHYPSINIHVMVRMYVAHTYLLHIIRCV